MKINKEIKQYLKSKENDYKIRSSALYLKFFVRKIIFFSVGILNNIFLKKTDEVPKNEAIILGRGKGVINYYTNRSYIKNIRHIFVVNFRDMDVPKGYLKKLNNKIVHLFISIAEVVPPLKYLKAFKIGKVIFSRCKMMQNLNYGRRKSFKADIILNRLEYMPDELINFWWLQNSGLFAMCYMSKIWKLKKIHLFGFNFYSDDYLNNSIENELKKANKKNYNPKEYQELIKASKKLKSNFIKLVKNCKNTNFYFHGKCKFVKKPKNLKLI